MAEGFQTEFDLPCALASVMARKGVSAAQIAQARGLPVPAGAAVAAGQGVAMLGVGPGSWLCLRHGADADHADRLVERLDGLASVVDQTGAYLVHRLTGEAARAVLQSGVAVDLAPEHFGAGSLAVTQIAHMGVILWQESAEPVWHIAHFRSFAGSFRHWLEDAAAAR